ncbi:MAG: hypothetical protein ACKV2T_40510 [Kofleriaceae bacterium]
MTRIALCGVFLALVACACPNKKTGGTGAGTGSGSGVAEVPPSGDACAQVRGKLEQLYRADAQANEPTRVDEATADNTAMVMGDCAKAPQKVAACVLAAKTVADIEKSCLERLDPAGNVIP